MTEKDTILIYRVLDANLNRLREALRVIEEYFRFISCDTKIAGTLKLLRHSIEDLERGFDPHKLLESRNTTTDPFAFTNRKEELMRTGCESVLVANFKRSQEAARVIEEYAKITEWVHLSEEAKKIRFTIYGIEKQILRK